MADKILAIDIGNTNIVLGIFRGESVVDFWRVNTVKKDVKQYLKLLPEALLNQKDIEGVVLATVVSDLKDVFVKISEDHLV